MCQHATSSRPTEAKPPTTALHVNKAFPADDIWRSAYDGSQKLPSKAEIKAALPADVFQRSASAGFKYVARDTAWALGCAFMAYYFLTPELPSNLLSLDMLQFTVGWSMYGFWMGK